jgi:hypothetical protein
MANQPYQNAFRNDEKNGVLGGHDISHSAYTVQ